MPMTGSSPSSPNVVHLANSYSNRRWTLDGVDTVVLACGSISERRRCTTSCAAGTRAVHLLGDAYAPRRLSFATRQARELVRTAWR